MYNLVVGLTVAGALHGPLFNLGTGPSKLTRSVSTLGKCSYLLQGFPDIRFGGLFYYSCPMDQIFEDYLHQVITSPEYESGLRNELEWLASRIFLTKKGYPRILISRQEARSHLFLLKNATKQVKDGEDLTIGASIKAYYGSILDKKSSLQEYHKSSLHINESVRKNVSRIIDNLKWSSTLQSSWCEPCLF